MPFTFSHPAIVLPLTKLSKRYISISGLIIGSMTPDFEYFIRMKVKSIYSHTWAGLFWWDLPLGIFLVFIYQRLLKDLLIQNLPMGLYRRFYAYQGSTITQPIYYYLSVVSTSVLIGATSHILWDGCTHPTGYFVSRLPIFMESVSIGKHSIAFYQALQHGSTILGAAIIIYRISALPQTQIKRPYSITNYWVSIFILSFIIVGIRLMTGLPYKQYGHVIVTVIASFLWSLIIISLYNRSRKT